MNEDKFLPEEMATDPEEACSVYSSILNLSLLPKPFGIPWTKERVREFLKARGYLIITRCTSEGKQYEVAVKPDEDLISDNGETNVMEVLSREISDIIYNWLLKIAE